MGLSFFHMRQVCIPVLFIDGGLRYLLRVFLAFALDVFVPFSHSGNQRERKREIERERERNNNNNTMIIFWRNNEAMSRKKNTSQIIIAKGNKIPLKY